MLWAPMFKKILSFLLKLSLIYCETLGLNIQQGLPYEREGGTCHTCLRGYSAFSTSYGVHPQTVHSTCFHSTC